VLSKVSGKDILSLSMAAMAASKVKARVTCEPLFTILLEVDMIFA